jgi:O-antigen/teichoic acid export membrane protein
MARYSVLPGKAGEARDFVRTLEVGYWAIGILIGCAVWYSAPYIASHWIKAGNISPLEVRRAVTIMGALTALQWPLTFYQGGLLGLQRQVLLNGITITTATLSGGGALLILWLVSPAVSAFFTWQIAVSLLQAAATTFALWRCLPGSGHVARFDLGITRGIWRFAAGMSGITITALMLTQLDKVILSKMLTLKTFGYYILAGVVGNGLSGVLITPMFNTIFPRFSSLVAAGDEKSLLAMYHGSTQVMAVMILPAAVVIAIFSPEIMLLWTGSPEIANNTASIVSILVGGTALNGLMNLPYALQLSHGWTRIGLAINAMFILTIVPAIVFMTMHYGAAGAASVWLGLNGIYMAIGVPLTHRRLLKGEAFRWFTKDVGIPLMGSLIIVGIARFIFPVFESPSRFIPVLLLLLVFVLTSAGVAMCTPATRDFIFNSVLNRKQPLERRS